VEVEVEVEVAEANLVDFELPWKHKKKGVHEET